MPRQYFKIIMKIKPGEPQDQEFSRQQFGSQPHQFEFKIQFILENIAFIQRKTLQLFILDKRENFLRRPSRPRTLSNEPRFLFAQWTMFLQIYFYLVSADNLQSWRKLGYVFVELLMPSQLENLFNVTLLTWTRGCFLIRAK